MPPWPVAILQRITCITSPLASSFVLSCPGLTSTCQARSVGVYSLDFCLQAYVDEVEAEARAGGAYGIGTERHLDGLAMLAHLPAGVELATVSVLYHGYANLSCGDS